MLLLSTEGEAYNPYVIMVIIRLESNTLNHLTMGFYKKLLNAENARHAKHFLLKKKYLDLAKFDFIIQHSCIRARNTDFIYLICNCAISAL